MTGLTKEWLSLISEQLFISPKSLFIPNRRSQKLFINPLSIFQPDFLPFYRFAGNLVGIAIAEKIAIPADFSSTLLKHLIGVQPSLEDIDDIDPELSKSMKWMIDQDPTSLEQPFIYERNIFNLRVLSELKPGGNELLITSENKQEFIDKLIQHKTTLEVKPQLEELKKGVYEIIPLEYLKICTPDELDLLISGVPSIDKTELKENLLFGDFPRFNLNIYWFFEVIDEMDQNMLKNFLAFSTGRTRTPYGGFKSHPIKVFLVNSDPESLPVAHTCFQSVDIPNYYSKEKLKDKLLKAILEAKEGFLIA